jgi:hypothetical protein
MTLVRGAGLPSGPRWRSGRARQARRACAADEQRDTVRRCSAVRESEIELFADASPEDVADAVR